MKLSSIFGLKCPEPASLPAFIRSVEDIRGVRVMRLQGPVGKDIGAELEEMHTELKKTGANFSMPLLIDFSGTTGCDFSTVAYLVRGVRDRMASGAHVGIINASKELIGELQIAKIENLFGIYATEPEALAGLGK